MINYDRLKYSIDAKYQIPIQTEERLINQLSSLNEKIKKTGRDFGTATALKLFESSKQELISEQEDLREKNIIKGIVLEQDLSLNVSAPMSYILTSYMGSLEEFIGLITKLGDIFKKKSEEKRRLWLGRK